MVVDANKTEITIDLRRMQTTATLAFVQSSSSSSVLVYLLLLPTISECIDYSRIGARPAREGSPNRVVSNPFTPYHSKIPAVMGEIQGAIRA
jgi:hypothetical protein